MIMYFKLKLNSRRYLNNKVKLNNYIHLQFKYNIIIFFSQQIQYFSVYHCDHGLGEQKILNFLGLFSRS